MLQVNDQVIFNVDFMKVKALGYIEAITGSFCRVRLAVPLCGRKFVNKNLGELEPSQDQKEVWERQKRENQFVLKETQSKTIEQLIEEIKDAKKI